jgi:hypothetical protein
MKPIRCLKKEILTKYVSSRSLREAIGVGRNFCLVLLEILFATVVILEQHCSFWPSSLLALVQVRGDDFTNSHTFSMRNFGSC